MLFLKKKYDSKTTYAVFFLWAIGVSVVSALVQKLAEYRNYYSYAFYLAMIIPVLGFFSDNLAKKIFVFVSSAFTEVIFLGISQTLSCTIFGEEFFTLGFLPLLVRAVTCALTVFLYYFLVKSVFFIAKKPPREDVWYILTLFPLIYTMLLVALFVKNTVIPIQGSSQLAFTLWAVFGVAAYFFVGRYIIMTTDRTETKRELELIDQFIGMEKHYFLLLNDSLNKARILRHDVKHHVTVLHALNSAGDKEGVEKYLGSIMEGLESSEVRKLCSNDELNIIFSHYLYKAENAGVRIVFRLDLPKDIKIDVTEFTVIWGNILENALRAVSEDKDERQTKEIEVSCKCIGDSVIMMEKNLFYGKIRRDVNGDFLTTKENGGLGLKSIRAIAEKYDGDCTVHFENDVYSIYVTLNGVV